MGAQQIHNKVQELRIEKRLTQEELATKIGVTRQTIISIEKGNYTPSLSLALLLGRTFNKNVEEVFWLE